MSLIKATNLHVVYNNASLASLKGVSFTIEQGKTTLFLGRSGSGKTTLLKCIAQLNDDYTGEIEFDGAKISDMIAAQRAKSIGFVAQHFNLFPHLTVLENCVHPQVHVLGSMLGAALETAEEVLEHLEIAHLRHKKSRELSGGQAQRVAIARALCMNPKLLLLDEPTSALDPESAKQLANVLQKLIADGITVAVSTHDMVFAKLILDRAYFMESGEIVEFFDVNLPLNSASNKIARFLA